MQTDPCAPRPQPSPPRPDNRTACVRRSARSFPVWTIVRPSPDWLPKTTAPPAGLPARRHHRVQAY
ncbi:MAG: hypothetical protein EOR04_01695 [Mesorhizobium sp.]|nr:MAG: hypothetical protein EOR04_01695 [Mesorhizobium sp.]